MTYLAPPFATTNMADLNRNASLASARTAKTSGTAASQPVSAAQYAFLEVLEIPSNARFELALSNRILARHSIVEAFGSISQRHPLYPTTHFLMSSDKPPVSVTPEDIQVYRIDTSEPVAEKGPRATPERFIHSEIYKRFPTGEVGSVIVTHMSEVLPFSIAKVLPFKAATTKSSFLGHQAAPVFDLSDVQGRHNDTLVRDTRSGAALAKLFDLTPIVPAKHSQGLFRSSSTKSKAPPVMPTRAKSCVLMRGHGAVLVGADIHIATLRAIYTRENARVITQMHALLGGIPGLQSSDEPHQGVKMLGEVECDLHTAAQSRQAKRSWDVWVAEVIHTVPGAEQGYHTEGTYLRGQQESHEEEALPHTTYRYSSATDASSPPRSTALAQTRSMHSTGPVASNTAFIAAKAPSVDRAPLDAVAPVTGASLHPPIKTDSALPGIQKISSQTPTEKTVTAPMSMPITGLGHAVGENSTHDGPAGELVTVNELAHKNGAPNGSAIPQAKSAAEQAVSTNELAPLVFRDTTRFREDIG